MIEAIGGIQWALDILEGKSEFPTYKPKRKGNVEEFKQLLKEEEGKYEKKNM